MAYSTDSKQLGFVPLVAAAPVVAPVAGQAIKAVASVGPAIVKAIGSLFGKKKPDGRLASNTKTYNLARSGFPAGFAVQRTQGGLAPGFVLPVPLPGQYDAGRTIIMWPASGPKADAAKKANALAQSMYAPGTDLRRQADIIGTGAVPTTTGAPPDSPNAIPSTAIKSAGVPVLLGLGLLGAYLVMGRK